MAKNYGAAKSAQTFQTVARKSQQAANVLQVKMLADEVLFDHPDNGEDLDNTMDLQLSIRQQGFTDPIEVTAFNMPDGQYMIVSGRRRRQAGRKEGVAVFPCIILPFSNTDEVKNYVLMANSHRDSVKDPLLYCKRYKMHEEYLMHSGFTGNLREEIASRLGISRPQADRYNQFNKIILPIWDMVRDDIVGMSSVLPMASHSAQEQEEILSMLNECHASGKPLTREECSSIIKAYRNGKRSYADCTAIEEPQQPVIPPVRTSFNFMDASSPEPKEKEERPNHRNAEVRREFDPIAAEMDREKADPYKEERLTEEDYALIDSVGNKKPKDPERSQEDQELARGNLIAQNLDELVKCLHETYTLVDDRMATVVISKMKTTAKLLLEEIQAIGEAYGKQDVAAASLRNLETIMEQQLKQTA